MCTVCIMYCVQDQTAQTKTKAEKKMETNSINLKNKCLQAKWFFHMMELDKVPANFSNDFQLQ